MPYEHHGISNRRSFSTITNVALKFYIKILNSVLIRDDRPWFEIEETKTDRHNVDATRTDTCCSRSRLFFYRSFNAHTLGNEQGAGFTNTIIYIYLILPGSSNDSNCF